MEENRGSIDKKKLKQLVQIGVCINIINETPDNMSPLEYTQHLQAAVRKRHQQRPPLSVRKPQDINTNYSSDAVQGVAQIHSHQIGSEDGTNNIANSIRDSNSWSLISSKEKPIPPVMLTSETRQVPRKTTSQVSNEKSTQNHPMENRHFARPLSIETEYQLPSKESVRKFIKVQPCLPIRRTVNNVEKVGNLGNCSKNPGNVSEKGIALQPPLKDAASIPNCSGMPALEKFSFKEYFEVSLNKTKAVDFILKNLTNLVHRAVGSQMPIDITESAEEVIQIIRACFQSNVKDVTNLCCSFFGNMLTIFSNHVKKSNQNDCFQSGCQGNLNIVCCMMKDIALSHQSLLLGCGEMAVNFLLYLLACNGQGHFVSDVGVLVADLLQDIVFEIQKIEDVEENIPDLSTYDATTSSPQRALQMIDVALKAITSPEALGLRPTVPSNIASTSFRGCVLRWRWILEDAYRATSEKSHHTLFFEQVLSLIKSLPTCS